MSVMLEYKCAVRAMLNNLKTSSDGGDTGSKKYVCFCLKPGVWSQAANFVLACSGLVWLVAANMLLNVINFAVC